MSNEIKNPESNVVESENNNNENQQHQLKHEVLEMLDKEKNDEKNKAKAVLKSEKSLKDKKDKKDKKSKKDKKKYKKNGKLKGWYYEEEMHNMQVELVKMQEYVKAKGLRIVVLFEGRDAAGKGGIIKRIGENMNPRYCKTVALGVPTEKEKTQWYFQRYTPYLPAAGEIVLFDRSWYNRAGVERVMGFCTDEQYWSFMAECPMFERMLIHSGIILLKYWFSVSEDVQEKRFKDRIEDPLKRWKFSPMDIEARNKWIEFSKAKDEMFAYTDTKNSPWFVVEADDKKKARLNCIHHFLSMIPYEDMKTAKIKLPSRPDTKGYVRPPITEQTFVPEVY